MDETRVLLVKEFQNFNLKLGLTKVSYSENNEQGNPQLILKLMN